MEEDRRRSKNLEIEKVEANRRSGREGKEL
jgi:hypothetical protein